MGVYHLVSSSPRCRPTHLTLGDTDSSDASEGQSTATISSDSSHSTRSFVGLTRSDFDWHSLSSCRHTRDKDTDVSRSYPHKRAQLTSRIPAALYTLSYRNILKRPEISELTGKSRNCSHSNELMPRPPVEDPSELFEDMRDKCDLHTLLASGDLSTFSAPIDKKLTEPIRKLHKLADVRPFPSSSHTS